MCYISTERVLYDSFFFYKRTIAQQSKGSD
nr:MAG TPA: hypothetical protein [Caudoviricetes sp.]